MSSNSEQVTTRQKTFGQKLSSYLERKSGDKDVTFIVGKQKEEIKALKVALKASSPAIETLFEEQWENGTSQGGPGGIALPDSDPEAFKVFLEILLSDDWSANEIKTMQLSPETTFNLIRITNQFKIPELEQTITSLTQHVYENFSSFSTTQEFLNLSSINLETVLSSDQIEVKEFDIFQSAARWAEARCKTMDVTVNGENLRKELGGALKQIRFPLMSLVEFTKVTCTEGILTNEEELTTFKYIGQSQLTWANMPSLELSFNTKKRGPTNAGAKIVDEIEDVIEKTDLAAIILEPDADLKAGSESESDAEFYDDPEVSDLF